MDEAGPMTGQQQEPEEQATPVAEDVAEQAPAVEETAAETTAEEAAVVEEAAADEIAEAETPSTAVPDDATPEEQAAETPEEPAEQLSLEEMVDSLKEAEPSGVEPPASDVEAPEPATDASAAALTSEEQVPEERLARDRLAARLPFGIYIGVWAVFAGVMTYLLWPIAVRPFVGTRLYAYFVLGGGALTVAGPLLGLGVWLAVRARAGEGTGAGLARAAFMRAAVATLAGDLLWWLGLVLLDLHRAGVLG